MVCFCMIVLFFFASVLILCSDVRVPCRYKLPVTRSTIYLFVAPGLRAPAILTYFAACDFFIFKCFVGSALRIVLALSVLALFSLLPFR